MCEARVERRLMSDNDTAGRYRGRRLALPFGSEHAGNRPARPLSCGLDTAPRTQAMTHPDSGITLRTITGPAAADRDIPLPVLMVEAACARIQHLSDAVGLAEGLHVVPEFLGNRAPFADPNARAVIAGLGMGRDFDGLVALYVAGLCGIGYGLRQIIETQARSGVTVERVVISGGAGASDLVRQVLADACGKPVVATRAEEPVLLGAAILGAVAGKAFGDMPAAMAAFNGISKTYEPAGGAVAAAHTTRFRRFRSLQDCMRSA